MERPYNIFDIVWHFCYTFNMKKRIIFFILPAIFTFNSASAVENGSLALNDPNAVAINSGWSGFLYSPRIVLTMAHNKDKFDSGQFSGITVGYPGQPANFGGKTIKGLKVIYSPYYKDREPGSILPRTSDIAVIILEKSMPMTNIVKIATQEQVETFKKNHSDVRMVGYGLQNLEMRKISEDHSKPSPQVNPSMITTKAITDSEAQEIFRRGIPAGGTYTQDVHFEQKTGVPSVCDNDSGSGWFVQEGNIRYYIGAQSGAWGIPNCGRNGTWNNNGALASVSAAYKSIDIIKQAEEFIKLHPEKITITCVKNKNKKTISGIKPVCPKGYLKLSQIK